MRPEITKVLPNDDFSVSVFFETGERRIYDAKPLIAKGGTFSILGNIDFFKQKCTIMNKTLAWDTSGKLDPTDCIDICPDTIYSGYGNYTKEKYQ